MRTSGLAILLVVFWVVIFTEAFNLPGGSSDENNKFNIKVPTLYPGEEEYQACLESCDKEKEKCNNCFSFMPRTDEEINVWKRNYIKVFTYLKDKSLYYAQSANVVSKFVGKAILDSTEIENAMIIAHAALELLKSSTKIKMSQYNQTRDEILLYNYAALTPSLRSVAKQLVHDVWFVFNNFNSMTREDNEQYRNSISVNSEKLTTVNTNAHNKLSKLRLVNAYCVDMDLKWSLMAIKPDVRYPESLVWKEQQIEAVQENIEYESMIKSMNRLSSQ